VDVWRAVEDRRLALAERVAVLDSAQWEADSWCEGWRVRDVFAHAADMLRPLGLDEDVDPSIVVPVLPVYRRLRRLAFQGESLRGVRLVATDADWTAGDGPELRGRAVDLLLFLANRHQAVEHLSGPGTAALR
jgi:hypothetical protein